jgi:hypothetical protein
MINSVSAFNPDTRFTSINQVSKDTFAEFAFLSEQAKLVARRIPLCFAYHNHQRLIVLRLMGCFDCELRSPLSMTKSQRIDTAKCVP